MNKVEWFVVILVITFLAGAASIMLTEPRVIKIDCRIAEISPDVPLELKQLCRKLNH